MRTSTNWMSKLDEEGPISLTVEFDEPSSVLEVALFIVFAAVDGGKRKMDRGVYD